MKKQVVGVEESASSLQGHLPSKKGQLPFGTPGLTMPLRGGVLRRQSRASTPGRTSSEPELPVILTIAEALGAGTLPGLTRGAPPDPDPPRQKIPLAPVT